MQKNAWHVSGIVKERIDDAQVLGAFLVGLLAEKIISFLTKNL